MNNNRKLYSIKAIVITTFLAGPFATGILLNINYRNLNQSKKGLFSLITGIVTGFLLIYILIHLPFNSIGNIISIITPFVITLITYFTVNRIQGNEVRLHKENNGRFYSGWKIVRVGLLSIFLVALSAFIAGDIFKVNYSFDRVYYNENMTRFQRNEGNAIEVLSSIETEDTNHLIRELRKSIILWNRNLQILDKISEMENLHIELSIQNEKLKEYCELNIHYFQTMLKALLEKNDKYESNIENTRIKIEEILDDLSKKKQAVTRAQK